ncbi:MAG: hypothetical protein KatS3mg111_4028 [Pirellulaceae bacterium]|nr:MAG: hypothetical protein KatS3mg111_4028 [Pirellulaceae bacterium]
MNKAPPLEQHWRSSEEWPCLPCCLLVIRLLACLIFFVTRLATNELAYGQPIESEDEMLRQWCDHGLSDTALAYVRAQLEQLREARLPDVAVDDLRARWTMRQMECWARRQLYLRHDTADGWSQLQAVAQEFERAYPQHRRLPWIRWQLARCVLLQIQGTYARYAANPQQSSLRDRALEMIRQVAELADEVRYQVQQRQPVAARLPADSPQQAPVDQLAQLRADADLLQCEAMMIRMQLYPRGSADRVAAATAIDQLASEALQRTDPGWSSRPALLTARAIARLELADPDRAVLELTDILRHFPHTAFGRRAGQAAVEWLIAQGQLSRARSLVEWLRQGEESPEAALSDLELRAAQLAREQGTSPDDTSLGELIEQVQQITTRFGTYWRNRAEAILLTYFPSQTSSASSASTQLIKAEVRQLLAADDVEAAVQRLQQATDQLLTEGNIDAATNLALLVAALFEREQQWLEAADYLVEVVSRTQRHSAAAPLHLRAIVAMAQSLRAEPNQSAVRQRYEHMLREHLQTWPQESSSNQVQQWLKAWSAQQGTWAPYAREVFQRALAVDDEQQRWDLLIEWLATVLALGDDVAAQVVAEAQQLIAARTTSPSDAARQDVDGRQALSSASGRSSFAPITADVLFVAQCMQQWDAPAESQRRRGELLTRLQTSDLPPLSSLLEQTILLEIARYEPLSSLQQQVAHQQTQPEEFPSLLAAGFVHRWVEAIDQRSPHQRPAWAKAAPLERLLAVSSASAEGASWETIVTGVDRLRAQVWLTHTPAEEAIVHLRQQAADHPRHGALQLSLINALIELSPPQWDEAMERTKRLISGTPAGSQLNFAARWQWVQLLRWQQRGHDAVAYARLVHATAPDMPEPWRSRFQAMASQ